MPLPVATCNILWLCYSLEKNTIVGVMLFDETLQVQSGVRHTGTTHGVKISNQERYSYYILYISRFLNVIPFNNGNVKGKGN